MRNNHLKNDTPTHTDITRLQKGQVGGQVCLEFDFVFKIIIQINN